MTQFIDEDGDLFGLVNIIDLLAVLLFLAVIVAGIALVFGTGETTENRATIDVEYHAEKVQPYVADAIPEGSVNENNIISITNKSVAPAQVVVESESGNISLQQHPTLKTVTFQARLDVTEQDDGYVYNGERLVIGSELPLDVGQTSVSGTITKIDPSGG